MGAKGEVNVKINFDSNLDELKKSAEQANLSDRQRDSFNRYIKGAEIANRTGGLGSTRKFLDNYRNAAAIIQKGLIASGNVSKALENLGKSLTEIQSKRNILEKEKESLTGKFIKDSNGKAALKVEGAKEYLNEFLQAKGKDIKSDSGHKLGTEEIAKRLEKVIQILGGKNLSTLTNKQAQNAGFADRNTVFLANQFQTGMDAQASLLSNRYIEVGGQISNYAQEEKEIQEKINALGPASNEAAAGIDALYKSITKLVSDTAQKANPQIKQEAQAMGGGKANNITISDQSMNKALKNITLYRFALRQLRRLYKEIISTITELDKSLTEQAMVTGKTRKETYQLLGTYQQLAKATGSTTKEVAEVTTQFIRQGKSVSEALTLTEAAIAAAKVASINVTDSVNYLTTALNGFQMAAEDAMAVSDKFAAVAAQSATSYEEIATALSKVASQANLAGMSMDYTIALLAKGIETTREAPETIGTALKTVIARMREITDYGETLEDGLDINNVETQLNYVGVALRTTTGELRSTEDVLDDLGKKWDTLNSNQQAAVAKALAGTRQQSRLIAMMSDYERVTELQQIAARSAGATSAQAATYLEGMAAATNNLKVSIEEVTTALTNSDAIIWIINSIATTIDAMTKNLWLTIPLFVLISGYLTYFTIQKNKQLMASMKITGNDIKQTIINIIRVSQEKQVTTEKEQQVILSKMAYGIIGLILLAIMAVLVVIISIVSNIQNINQKLGDLNAEIYNLNKQLTIIKENITVFDEMDAKLIKTTEDAQSLNDALANIGNSLDTETGKLAKRSGYKNATDALKKYYEMGGKDNSLADVYETLSDVEKKKMAEVIADSNAKAIQTKRDASFVLINKSIKNKSAADAEAWIRNNANASAAINSAANQKIYDLMDNNKTLDTAAKTSVETVVSTIVGELSYLNQKKLVDNPTQMQNLIDKFTRAVSITNSNGESTTMTFAEAISDESITLAEQIQLYKSQMELLSTEEGAIFKDKNKTLASLSEMSAGVIKFADAHGIAAESMDAFLSSYKAINKIAGTNGNTFTKEQWDEISIRIMESLANNNYNIGETASEIAKYYKLNTEQQLLLIDKINVMVSGETNDWDDRLTKFHSTVEKYYEAADKFNEMTVSEKQDLLEQTGMTAELYEAIASGDYARIRDAIANSETMEDYRQQLLQTLDEEIAAIQAKADLGDETAKAQLKNLIAERDALKDINKLYQISYAKLYERQNEQLDAYKELLEDETNATKKALEDRKEAYEKYFEAINQTAEDENYYQEVELLTNAMTALSTSNTGEARAKLGELEKKLKDLNTERQQTLRERAQDAILENIDDQINSIEENMEELTKSNVALLALMERDFKDSDTFMARLLTNKVYSETNSNLDLINYVDTLEKLFPGQYDFTAMRNALSNVSYDYDKTTNTTTINISGVGSTTITDENKNSVIQQFISWIKENGL